VTLRPLNPATGQLLRELPEASAAEVAAAVERARLAQPGWAARPLAERLATARRFVALIATRAEELSRMLTCEVGKPIAQARSEVGRVHERIDFFVERADRALAPETVHRDGGLEERIAREPLGVVANISAWNYPWFVGANVFAPALICGNAVVYKPSEHASLTGMAIAELWRSAGVPEDVFIALVGGGATGAALAGGLVDAVCFTGSYATGVKIAAAAAPRLAKVQLELGGKDPVYVRADVDVGASAAATADGAFYNAGQSCCAIERLYVHERVHDAFVERFLAEVKGFRIGDPLDEATYIGPLAREPQLAALEAQVADAVAKGARLACGGRRLDRPGWYFAPTVLLDVDHRMAVMREESFGPIIGIQRVRSDDEALDLINDSPYGLTAGVYTRDQAVAERLLARVDSGSAYWNCCDRVSPRLPWTGRGWSGIGGTLGIEGLLAFTRPKAYHLRAGG
jgi:acyl-CoA reductase-like NAD-dependent aldehyde dehydrogenase